jgi:hypothetical protein
MKEPTLIDRITRLESRLVVGFEQLGVDVKARRPNVEVDHIRRIINVPSEGVSLKVLMQHLSNNETAAYRVDVCGEPVCMIGRYTDTL